MSDNQSAPKRLAPQESSRMIGADIVRIAACFSVISIHFLLNSKFYDYPINETNMYIMLVMRMLFSICVPLFIILTGYLLVNRTLSLSHYGKGMKVIWIYLLCSLACILYKLYICHAGTWDKHLKDILVFQAAPYSWYIEMYIGLFLLIPFLNLIYRNLPSRKWKIALVITLLALNSIPKFANSFNFTDPGWWSDPTISTQYQRILPRWWYYNTYPLAYYFIGAYLREYGLRLNGIVHRVLIVVTLGLSTLFELWRSGSGNFNWGVGSEWDFLLTVILASLIFALLVQKPYRHMPRLLAKVIRYVSGLTLSIFMVSYIFDDILYKILKKNVPHIPDRLWSYFWIVPAVFLASMAISAVIDLIYRIVSMICRDIRNRFRPSRKAPAHAEPAPVRGEPAADALSDQNEPEFIPDPAGDMQESDAAVENVPESDTDVIFEGPDMDLRSETHV